LFLEKKPRPTEIAYTKRDKILRVLFDDGFEFKFPSEFLRVESPSAEVQGHSQTEKIIVPGKKYVGIINIEKVGHYAIKIDFTDGHNTGIYSWEYLYKLGKCYENIWNQYLTNIRNKKLNRELA
tara:strand:- start:1626 stop:1997 length:372 start_codon:yes stop_codon:yes gene_type:complete